MNMLKRNHSFQHVLPHRCVIVTLLVFGFALTVQSPVWAASEPDTADTLAAAWASDVVVGDAHTCALTTTGEVWCWGDNSYAQLGVGTRQQHTKPVEVLGAGHEVRAIAAGPAYTCAAWSDYVTCWGAIMRERREVVWTRPTQIFNYVNVVALAAGTGRSTQWQAIGHTCALTSDGDVYCWGINDNGQLGNGTTIDQDYPTLVSGIDQGATAIAAGDHHTCALVRGGVKCWGLNAGGQLGDGTGATSRWAPVDVVGLEHGVIALDAGGNTSCAVTGDHAVKCWGGSFGNVPVQWLNTDPVLTTSISSTKVCALRADGQVYCSPFLTMSVPTDRVPDLDEVVVKLDVGRYHRCAVLEKGTVKCWGNNDAGQIGIGESTTRAIPVEITTLATNASAVTTYVDITCALDDEGAVWCWGRSDCIEVEPWCKATFQPKRVLGLTEGARAIGGLCAVTNSGGVKCWDSATWTAKTVPGLATGVSAVAAGAEQTCALTEAGAVKCWGSGIMGQCGNGEVKCNATPTDVVGLTNNVRAIAAAGDVSCAVTDAGQVKCWGRDVYENQAYAPEVCFRITDRVTEYCYTKPADVVGLPSGITAVALGRYACALAATGEVACWGEGLHNVEILDTNAVEVAVGGGVAYFQHLDGQWDWYGTHACAVHDTGKVWCWGDSTFGQVGNGNVGGLYDTPQAVIGLGEQAVTSISAGIYHTCAVTASGSVWCWGLNREGQLGINSGQTPLSVIGFGVEDVVLCRLPAVLR